MYFLNNNSSTIVCQNMIKSGGRMSRFVLYLVMSGVIMGITFPLQADELERLKYNHPGLAVDLGVGLWAWPIPVDVNGDGHIDLVVNCDDKPYNGVYVFLNPGTGDAKFPIFKPGVRISQGTVNVQPSYVDGKLRVMTPGKEYPDFLNTGLQNPVKLPLPENVHPNKVRGNMWRYVDFNGDGKHDIIVGTDDWTDYGWDNAYDEAGKWMRGPLRGNIYVAINIGTNESPEYEKPFLLRDVAGDLLETFGWPSPNFADWDGDGDLDIICGEFRDGFTYFQNVGTRTEPKYLAGVPLCLADGSPLKMDLQMVTPVAFDWDGDGDLDLICGDEDGRVALIENTGKLRNMQPVFLPPRYFQQEAADLKCGALANPVACDWDGDGDLDIICGNTAGYVMFFENLSRPGDEFPKWAAPKYLEADGDVIRIMAGPNGSIQGPAEAKWGYTTLSVADWDCDGRLDLIVNSIWGKVVWYRNVGTKEEPKLAASQPVEVAWNSPQPTLAWGWMKPQENELLTQWRTTPVVFDWNKDGLPDLIMLDQEGYLSFFERKRSENGELVLLPPKRIFVDENDQPIRLNGGKAGASGRRKLRFGDYDGDGKVDFLVNGANAEFWKNVGEENGLTRFQKSGNLDTRLISGHDTSPGFVDFNGDGVPDLLIGAEDGYIYYKRNDVRK